MTATAPYWRVAALNWWRDDPPADSPAAAVVALNLLIPTPEQRAASLNSCSTHPDHADRCARAARRRRVVALARTGFEAAAATELAGHGEGRDWERLRHAEVRGFATAAILALEKADATAAEVAGAYYLGAWKPAPEAVAFAPWGVFLLTVRQAAGLAPKTLAEVRSPALFDR